MSTNKTLLPVHPGDELLDQAEGKEYRSPNQENNDAVVDIKLENNYGEYQGYKFITINARGEKIQVEESLVNKYFKNANKIIKDGGIYVNYSADTVHKLLDELNKYEDLEDVADEEKKSLELTDIIKLDGTVDIDFEKELQVYDFRNIKVDDVALMAARKKVYPEPLNNESVVIHPIIVILNKVYKVWHIAEEIKTNKFCRTLSSQYYSHSFHQQAKDYFAIEFNRKATIREYVVAILRNNMCLLSEFYPIEVNEI